MTLEVVAPQQGLKLLLEPGDPPLTIGRHPESGILFANRLVSARHARIRYDGGGWIVEDLGSTNGTYVDGNRQQSTTIPGSLRVAFGDPHDGEVITATQIERDADTTATRPGAVRSATESPELVSQNLGEIVFAVEDLTVETAGVRRLDRVSFALPPRTMLAVLGGSGAGKSTLVKAITGSDPATSGRVSFEGVDPYTDFDAVRRKLGYVPQDDILHSALTVRQTLDFSARLRMPDDTPTERQARVHEVLNELGISHRIDALVSELSGGQRKRLNVAIELLSRPPLLILDEPTSGLDPANERALMDLLRSLADGGRTVIVVTHSTESLHLCDDVLVLARGGVPAYLGPSSGFAAEFGQPALIDAFAYVDNHPDPPSLRGSFADGLPPLAPRRPPAGTDPDRSSPHHLADQVETLGRDTWTLIERSMAVLLGDRRNSLIIAAQAPVISVLLILLFHGGLLDPADAVESKGKGASLLLALVLAVIFIGASSTVREIVKERAIMLREQAVGVSPVSYLASKSILWSVIVLVQSMLIVVVVTMFNSGPTDGLLHLGPVNEVVWVVVLTGCGAVASGLFISAMVSSNDKAMTILPIYLFVQLLLAGLIVPVHDLPMRIFSWLVTSKWGLDGVGSVGQLNTLRTECGVDPSECSANWDHTSGNLLLSLIVLTAMVVALTYATYRVLSRTDPSQVLNKTANDRADAAGVAAPAAEPAADWYYVKDGTTNGPVSVHTIKMLVSRGQLGNNDRVRHAGWSAWWSITDAAGALGLTPSELTVVQRGQTAAVQARVAAWAIDLAVLGVALVVSNLAFGFYPPLASLVAIAATLAYLVVLPTVGVHRLGHLVIGLRVVDANSLERPTRQAHAARGLVLLLFAAPMLLGSIGSALNVSLSTKRLAWHDAVTGTIVIKRAGAA